MQGYKMHDDAWREKEINKQFLILGIFLGRYNRHH
jgi:hypothetical protein